MLRLAGFQAEAQEWKKHDPEQAEKTLSEFKKVESGIAQLVSKAYEYAVFPSIGKGAIGIGGAAGKDVVYKKDRPSVNNVLNLHLLLRWNKKSPSLRKDFLDRKYIHLTVGDSCTTCGYHQHAATLTDGLIIQIDAHYCACT